MQAVNNKIFDSIPAVNGKWRNISNFAAFSVHLRGIDGTIGVEVSNDPNVMIDGPTIAAPAAPTVTQVTAPLYNPTQGGSPFGSGSFGGSVFGPSPTSVSVQITYVTPGGGETTPSAATSLTINPGNTVLVTSPVADPARAAVAYNVYIQFSSGTFQLQNPANNSAGTAGNVPQNGPVPLGQPFLLYVYQNTGTTPPVSNTSNSPAAGINIGNFNTATVTGAAGEIQIVADGAGNLVWNPSCIFFNFLRFTKTGIVLTLTSVATSSGGVAVYTGTITNGAGNALAGQTFVVAGFVTAANNGTFLCTASTATTLTLQNGAAVAETHAATATNNGSLETIAYLFGQNG